MLSFLVFFYYITKVLYRSALWCLFTFISVTIFFIINNTDGNKSNNNASVSSQEHKGLSPEYQLALKYMTDAIYHFLTS